MSYLIRLRGQQQGPFTADQLQKLASRGRFSRSYEVSTDDGVSWQRAEAFPELFPKLPPRRGETAPATADKAATAAAEQPGEEWYYTHAGAELGPTSVGELKRLIGLGQVVAEDHVWTEGMDYWQRVRDVPELARQLTANTAAALPPTPQTSPMAVASFILGLLGFTLIGSILAIVFGHIALSQIRQSQGKLGGKGLAIVGLVLGYLVVVTSVIAAIVVIAILALAPSGSRIT
ncbi:MAG TPA: GYF domain-containing protein [Pirellulaceae bacterium]|nr:GYF domain-containing protein [Pirellulaceae bacterium]